MRAPSRVTPHDGSDAASPGDRTSRRGFLGGIVLSGAALALPSLAGIACGGDTVTDPTQRATLDFSTDAGVLNYFYAITQLQTDFWTRVNLNRFPGIATTESSAFASFASHATSQRDWLSTYQTNGRITDVLVFSFGASVDFASRTSTFAAGMEIEDSASQAYAGGISYLKTAANATLAAKLASIAARHSATLRDLSDLFAGGTTRSAFAADSIVTGGLEAAATPSSIMTTLDKYFATDLSVKGA